MSESNSVLKSYRFPIILLGAIALGCVIGAVMGERALILKPLRYAAPSLRCRRWNASARS